METAADVQPHDDPQMQREIMLSYCERQLGVRRDAELKIIKDPLEEAHKVERYNADCQLDRLLGFLFEMTVEVDHGV